MANNSKSKYSYSYVDAGFDSFMTRSIARQARGVNLQQMAENTTSSRTINFDEQQVSGSIGDVLTIGDLIELNGTLPTIDLRSAVTGEVLTRIGELG